jgi:hypothetical protein
MCAIETSIGSARGPAGPMSELAPFGPTARRRRPPSPPRAPPPPRKQARTPQLIPSPRRTAPPRTEQVLPERLLPAFYPNNHFGAKAALGGLGEIDPDASTELGVRPPAGLVGRPWAWPSAFPLLRASGSKLSARAKSQRMDTLPRGALVTSVGSDSRPACRHHKPSAGSGHNPLAALPAVLSPEIGVGVQGGTG